MNWAPTLSNPHIVSIQWCSERSQGALNGRSWSSQPLYPTDGIQHPGAHSERSVLFPVAAPTVCSPHSPSNHCTVIHGLKNHYPCWTGSPLVRLRCREAWPASQTLSPLCLHHPNLFTLPSLCTNASLVRFMICPLPSCNPHSLWPRSDCLSFFRAWERDLEREARSALPGAFSGFHLRLQSDFPFMYYRRA